jgi:hypothetical protein
MNIKFGLESDYGRNYTGFGGRKILKWILEKMVDWL